MKRIIVILVLASLFLAFAGIAHGAGEPTWKRYCPGRVEIRELSPSLSLVKCYAVERKEKRANQESQSFQPAYPPPGETATIEPYPAPATPKPSPTYDATKWAEDYLKDLCRQNEYFCEPTATP